MRAKRYVAVAFIIIIVVVLVSSFFICLPKLRYPLRYMDAINKSSREQELDVYYLLAIIKTESGFNTRAVSKKGAIGLMQLLPSTAEFICEQNDIEYRREDLILAEYNIELGAMYLRYLLDKFETYEYSLLAYNSGEGRLKDWLEEGNSQINDYPYPESQSYIKKIEKYKIKYQELYYLY